MLLVVAAIFCPFASGCHMEKSSNPSARAFISIFSFSPAATGMIHPKVVCFPLILNIGARIEWNASRPITLGPWKYLTRAVTWKSRRFIKDLHKLFATGSATWLKSAFRFRRLFCCKTRAMIRVRLSPSITTLIPSERSLNFISRNAPFACKKAAMINTAASKSTHR